MLLRASVRYYARHPWLLVLSVLGIALGVSLVVAVDVANVSATRAFTQATETVAGRATHQLVGPAGSVAGEVYGALRRAGFRNTAPVVEGYVQVRGQTVQLLGVDPFADTAFRPVMDTGIDLGLFLATPNTVFLGPSRATQWNVSPGDTLHVVRDGQVTVLTFAALLETSESDAVLEALLVMDVATAQRVMGWTNRLSRIDVLAETESELAALAAALPEGVEMVRPEARTASLERMTEAFRLNLTALSFLALIVGMFLVYNTMTFSVVQRRTLFGRLRAMGMHRSELLGLVLGEALLLGGIGTGLGVLLGISLGAGLVQLVTQTITDLYFVVSVREVSIAPFTLAKGLLVGLLATLGAAYFPAREASLVSIQAAMRRSSTESNARARTGRLALAGVAGLVLGGMGLYLSTTLPAAYGSLLFVIVGFAGTTPWLLRTVSRSLRAIPFASPMFRMAAGGLENHLSRISVAVAAFAVALAATIGVGVMVQSFRVTVVSWLEAVLQADVYIQPPTLVARGGDSRLTPETIAQLTALDGIDFWYTIRTQNVETNIAPLQLVAISGGARQEATFRLKTGAPEDVWPLVRDGTHGVVSEPFALRHGVGLGDTITVDTERGATPFIVAGIHFDYASDLGAMVIYRSRYAELFADEDVSGLALFAAPGVDPDALRQSVEQAAIGGQAVIVRSNAGLRSYVLDLFDRTFLITAVLRMLALGVAFVGILSAFMALLLERSREFAVLRATGVFRKELWQIVTLESAFLGLSAGMASVPLGLVLAGALIYVINVRSFGWTLQVHVDPLVLLTAVALALAAAVLAALYPAWKSAQAAPAQALREE